jgi:hypothetical protein
MLHSASLHRCALSVSPPALFHAQGAPLRHSKSLSLEEAGAFAREVSALVAAAVAAVRDVEPRDDLHVLRVRTREERDVSVYL